MREDLDRHLHLGLDLQFRAQIAYADDQVLQDRHLGFGREIELLLIRLRIRRQRDRLQRRLAFVHRLPDFFGNERHDRMQQAQRRLEQIHQVRTGSLRRALVGAFFEIQARLDQFQVPVAELSPEEVVDAIRRLVEAIGRRARRSHRRDAIEARENPAVFESAAGEMPATPV